MAFPPPATASSPLNLCFFFFRFRSFRSAFFSFRSRFSRLRRSRSSAASAGPSSSRAGSSVEGRPVICRGLLFSPEPRRSLHNFLRLDSLATDLAPRGAVVSSAREAACHAAMTFTGARARAARSRL
eukprot:31497-Pelagococcus_subviridis.AAC.40